MPKDQLKALMKKLESDADLRNQIKNSTQIDEVLSIVNGLGFSISKADIIRDHAEWVTSLSDAELEAVAGGGNTNPQHGDSACIPACHEAFVSQYFPCNTNVGPWGPGNCTW
jgi:predicted ribosomally synthesized peptide with nif11-like leader